MPIHGYTLCMSAWMRHTANCWRNAWASVTKHWNVCFVSEATIQTMAHALGDFLRLIIFEELLFQRTYFFFDERRHQALEFCRRSFEALKKTAKNQATLTGTQESCTTPSCGPWPPGLVRFLTECFRGWKSSWSIELSFNEARRVSSENLARRLSNLAMWRRTDNSYVVVDVESTLRCAA